MPCKPPVESSPRMQGALPSAENHSKHYRIIPADAGSTPGCRCEYCTHKDHPRGCGEHHVDQRLDPIGAGSSPRMRGALCGGVLGHVMLRIIPADAGSTNILLLVSRPHKDHPRGCGEHDYPGRDKLSYLGSSPRMRGAPGGPHVRRSGQRIIPADAGSTATALQTA